MQSFHGGSLKIKFSLPLRYYKMSEHCLYPWFKETYSVTPYSFYICKRRKGSCAIFFIINHDSIHFISFRYCLFLYSYNVYTFKWFHRNFHNYIVTQYILKFSTHHCFVLTIINSVICSYFIYMFDTCWIMMKYV